MIKPIRVNHCVWRGPQPKTVEDFKLLKSLDIQYLLDLETGSSLLRDGSPLAESINAEFHGLKSYSHPLSEILPPSRAQLNLARAFILSHQSVYVHCKAGVDRTGMVIAFYQRESLGLDNRAVIKGMKDEGMHWWYRFWWPWFL